MARKTKTVTINKPGSRDHGKTYLLTEMPADKAERWAIRATIMISHTDVGEFVSPQMMNAGWAALAYGALQALYRIEMRELEPLLDEMMDCVQYIPDPAFPLVMRKPTFDGDIEDVATRLMLRSEVFNLHMDFSLADVLSRLAPARTGRGRRSRTSPRRSPQSSPAA